MQQENKVTIEEMNRVIAEFMGYYFQSGKFYPKNSARGAWFKEAKYHVSWDAFMPVVKKIKEVIDEDLIFEEKDFDYDIFNIMMIWIKDINIKNAHADVYLIIIWYNQNKTQNQ